MSPELRPCGSAHPKVRASCAAPASVCGAVVELGAAGGIGADLIVSGGYGRGRLREWAFGGVTRSLLDEAGRNRFMAS